MPTTRELLSMPHLAAFKSIVQENLKDRVSVEMYRIDPPTTVEVNESGVLTKVVMGLHPGLTDVTFWAYMGDVDFTYYRLLADSFFASKNLDFVVDFPIYIHQIAKMIEQRHGVVIDQDEYENVLLTENEEGNYDLVFSEISYRFVGSLTFKTTIRVKPLTEVIRVTDVGQLAYPENIAQEIGVRDKLLSLVNDLNVTRLHPHLLTNEWVAWRDFVPLDNGAARMKLRVKANVASNKYYSGEITIDYVRRNIEETFDGPYIPIVSETDSFAELVAEISAQTGVYLMPSDFIEINLPSGQGVHYLTFHCSPSSEHYYGTKTVELTRP